MSAFPKPCGRLDRHDEHEWTGNYPAEAIGSNPQQRTYNCIGRVLVEGGYWLDWDAEDDATEDRLDRQIRERLDGWGNGSVA